MLKAYVFAACVLLITAVAAPARAADVALTTDATKSQAYGAWKRFDVDDQHSRSSGVEWIDLTDSDDVFGTPLTFTFTIAEGTTGSLTVVDAGFAGDTYQITNFGNVIGATSAVAGATYPDVVDVGNDYLQALNTPSFSQYVFTFAPGDYRISGRLLQSVLDADSTPLNYTFGAVSLEIAPVPVPEPATYATLLAGLGFIGLLLRRRR